VKGWARCLILAEGPHSIADYTLTCEAENPSASAFPGGDPSKLPTIWLRWSQYFTSLLFGYVWRERVVNEIIAELSKSFSHDILSARCVP